MKANKTFINFSRLARINKNILNNFNKDMAAKFAKIHKDNNNEEEVNEEDEAGSDN